MSEASEKSIAKLKKLIDDDERVKEYIRAEDALRVYSIGRRKLRQIAIEAGAYYKVGRMVLIRIERFEEYLEKHRIGGK